MKVSQGLFAPSVKMKYTMLYLSLRKTRKKMVNSWSTFPWIPLQNLQNIKVKQNDFAQYLRTYEEFLRNNRSYKTEKTKEVYPEEMLE